MQRMALLRTARCLLAPLAVILAIFVLISLLSRVFSAQKSVDKETALKQLKLKADEIDEAMHLSQQIAIEIGHVLKNKKADWNVKRQNTSSDGRNDIHHRDSLKLFHPDYPVSASTIAAEFCQFSLPTAFQLETLQKQESEQRKVLTAPDSYYQSLVRAFEVYLRAGEIMFSLAAASSYRHKMALSGCVDLMFRCTSARQLLTEIQQQRSNSSSSADVTLQHRNKVKLAIEDMKKVMNESAQLLMIKYKHQYHSKPNLFYDNVLMLDDFTQDNVVLDVRSSPRTVVFYNSLAHSRTNAVRLRVNSPTVKVTNDATGRQVVSQADCVFRGNTVLSNEYQLVFVATVPPAGMSRYTISDRSTYFFSGVLHTMSSVTLYNTPQYFYRSAPVGEFQYSDSSDKWFSIANSFIAARFSSLSGMLQEIKLKDLNKSLLYVNLSFVRYSAVFKPDSASNDFSSFHSHNPPKSVNDVSPMIRVIRGTVASEVHVVLTSLTHTVRLSESIGMDGQAMEMLNIVDGTVDNNSVLVMRLQAALNNTADNFYSDFNSFMMQRRKTYSKLPVNANFYPMTTMSYLQDSHLRLSVLSALSPRVSSLKPGQLDVTLSRQFVDTVATDNVDNLRIMNHFRVVVEPRPVAPDLQITLPPQQSVYSFPSLLSHRILSDLLHPVFVLSVHPATMSTGPTLASVFQPFQHEMPCHIQLVSMSSVSNSSAMRCRESTNAIGGVTDGRPSAVLSLRRLAFDCGFTTSQLPSLCWLRNVSLSLLGVQSGCPLLSESPSNQELPSNSVDTVVTAHLDLSPMQQQSYIVQLH